MKLPSPARRSAPLLLLLLLLLLLAAAGALASPAGPLERDLAFAEQAAVLPQAVELVLVPEAYGAEGGPRDKRLVETKVIKHFGVKNYLLNLIFGKINQAIDHKTALVAQLDRFNIQKNAAFGLTGHSQPCTSRCRQQPRPRPSAPPEPDPDVPEFDRNAVSLDIPSEVFGSSFTLLNNVGLSLGRVIENTAMRTQRFVEALKPLLGGKLGVTTRGRSIRDPLGSNLIR